MLLARERGRAAPRRGRLPAALDLLWYEEQPQRGLAVLQDLRAPYPHNPLFAQRIAEVQVEYFHDPAASLATWQELLAAGGSGVHAAPIARRVHGWARPSGSTSCTRRSRNRSGTP